jgi:LysR family glycine cleavage system transcriptional activator
VHLRDAVANLAASGNDRVLVISTPPGLTSKWLAPRLYRFAAGNPAIDTRVTSSMESANFMTDGVDVAVRNLAIDGPQDPALEVEPLLELCLVPVCSPKFVATHGPFKTAEALKRLPLIHDDTLANRASVPTWRDWFAAAGAKDADVSRGLRFNGADHALDATVEGAGVLLAHDVLAYDDLRTGRLVIPFALTLRSGRGYYFVCPKQDRERPIVRAFRAWLKEEVAALDWTKWRKGLAPRVRKTPGSPARRGSRSSR